MEYQDRSYLNSNDRRVKKTNRALKDSLDELLKTKDFHKITVQNIIDLADITKSTFYRHYADKYELVEHIIENELKNFYIEENNIKQALTENTLINIKSFILRLKPYRSIQNNNFSVDSLIKSWLANYFETILRNNDFNSVSNKKVNARLLAACILELIELYQEDIFTISTHNIQAILRDLNTITYQLGQRDM